MNDNGAAATETAAATSEQGPTTAAGAHVTPVRRSRAVGSLAESADSPLLEPLLRAFEWRLLDELGYGFALDRDARGTRTFPGPGI